MPIEEVVARYGRTEEEAEDKSEDDKAVKDSASSAPKAMLINPAVAELSKKGRKPTSPFLRAKSVSKIQSDTKEGDSKASSAEVKAETDGTETTETATVKNEPDSEKTEESEVKVNGDIEKSSSTNGHSDEKESNGDVKTAPTVNGESPESVEVVSVKGKGKGKGKSSMAVVSSDAANAAKDGEGDEAKIVPKKKKVFKSAEELYHHVLGADSDGDDEDLDDEDDDNFGESGESEDDSDDYEDMVRITVNFSSHGLSNFQRITPTCVGPLLQDNKL